MFEEVIGRDNTKHLWLRIDWHLTTYEVTMYKQIKGIAALFIVFTQFSLGSGLVHATERDRLLSTALQSKVISSIRQDGAAFYIGINNQTSLVVTSATLTCYKYNPGKPRPAKASNGKAWCGLHSSDVINGQVVMLEDCEIDLPTPYYINEAIQPGKATETYFELLRDSPVVTQCLLVEVRAREPSFIERMKNKL